MAERTILIVEDDPVNARVLGDLLRSKGHRTLFARNAKAALEWFRLEPPDLVLLDVMLPGRNGFEVCFDIKRDPRAVNTRVLLMSAVYQHEDAEQLAGDLRADGFLRKPFELSELIERVDALLPAA
jgi:DNA-binding response OmpR family regulator